MFGFMLKEAGKTVHVNDMDQLIGKVDIIDIRETYEYKSGSLRTAKNIPMGNLLNSPEKYLEKEKEYGEMFANPYKAAERGFIDEVILPEESRRKIIKAFTVLANKKKAGPMRKHGNIPL